MGSFMADLSQDISGGFTFSRCLYGTLPWRNAPLRHWYINPNEKSNKYKSYLLNKLTNALIDHFLQGNVPLRQLLNAKPPFMSWRRSAFNEVNNWAPVLGCSHCWEAILSRDKSDWNKFLYEQFNQKSNNNANESNQKCNFQIKFKSMNLLWSPIVYIIEGKSLSRHKRRFCPNGTFPWRKCSVKRLW